MQKEISLYIHIPFCESKCYYCNFVSFNKSEKEKQKYVNFLCDEIKLYKNMQYIIKSIFIGGGTPSCLSENSIQKIFKTIKENFKLKQNCEISIEINPNSFSENKAKTYKNCGINRLSFGLQSGVDRLLKKINRIHTKKDFINALKIAQKVGFFNINADILLGIPDQKLLDVKKTLRLIKKLKLPHVSCYSLILEENTKLYSLVKQKKLSLPSEEKTIKMYDYCQKYLEKLGIKQYEVSNFAKIGFECKHNLVYWDLGNYIGFGLNSHSKINNLRYENFADFETYYDYIKKGKKPIKDKQKLSLSEQKEEYIMLKLRKTEGMNLVEFENLFNENLISSKQKNIDFLLKNKFIQIKNNNLSATKMGFKVLNQIILSLI